MGQLSRDSILQHGHAAQHFHLAEQVRGGGVFPAALGQLGEPCRLLGAALALADDSFDNVWRQASEKPDALADLVNGIPRLPEPEFRARAYVRVKPLLEGEASGSPKLPAGTSKEIFDLEIRSPTVEIDLVELAGLYLHDSEDVAPLLA